MKMVRTAVIFSVICSLFLLSDARLRPYLPDGSGASSSDSLAVVNPEEGNYRETITRPLEASSDASTAAADTYRKVAFSLRRPIKLRCRHARMGRHFALPLALGSGHDARVIPFGLPGRHRVHHGGDAVGFPVRSRIQPGFTGENRRFPTRPGGFGGGVEGLPFETVQPDVRRIWAREADREEGKREEAVEGGGSRGRFRKHKEKRREADREVGKREEEKAVSVKRFGRHKEERGEGGFMEWFRTQKRSLKKRFWGFINRF